MGYEIGVTPLQVAAAASVVANGGSLVEPHILRAVTRDGRRETIQPKVLRRVITPETATTMTALMEGVAERGTAKGAALTRYQVAGKPAPPPRSSTAATPIPTTTCRSSVSSRRASPR
jgi:cell division protein FtsI/penicillin-binding protein 2